MRHVHTSEYICVRYIQNLTNKVHDKERNDQMHVQKYRDLKGFEPNHWAKNSILNSLPNDIILDLSKLKA